MWENLNLYVEAPFEVVREIGIKVYQRRRSGIPRLVILVLFILISAKVFNNSPWWVSSIFVVVFDYAIEWSIRILMNNLSIICTGIAWGACIALFQDLVRHSQFSQYTFWVGPAIGVILLGLFIWGLVQGWHLVHDPDDFEV